MKERDISRLLAQRENGQCEVRTPVGFIDVLTLEAIYEVKEFTQWKSAVGQLLAYARYYTNHTPKLYLYGEATGKQKSLIKEHCKPLGIHVVWHKEQPFDTSVSPPDPFTSTKTVPNKMKLHILVIDHNENMKATCAPLIAIPDQPLSDSVLEAYADEAFVMFDKVLSNEVYITLQYACYGENKLFQRHRPDISGIGVYNRFNLTIGTGTVLDFTVSIPSMKRTLPSGSEMMRNRDYYRATDVPEITELFAFIRHPQFCWVNRRGERAIKIKSAHWKK